MRQWTTELLDYLTYSLPDHVTQETFCWMLEGVIKSEAVVAQCILHFYISISRGNSSPPLCWYKI